MHNNLYIFDVDGTLTPSRQKMTDEFSNFFNKWSDKNRFYLVTGSDLKKTEEQVPEIYLKKAEGIFTCCGNQAWRPDPHVVNIGAELIYDNNFEVSKKLKSLLDVILMSSPYPHRYGNHIEDRGSMVNFSIVGRDCTQEQREDFFRWDNENNEREKISKVIKQKFPELDAVIGGQISIDIYPRGNDKSQILKHIQDYENQKTDGYADNEYIFMGDRTKKGGNDYPLAKLMEAKNNSSYHQVEDYRKTWWLLQKYDLESLKNDQNNFLLNEDC